MKSSCFSFLPCLTASAVKVFSNLIEAVGDHVLASMCFSRSPLTTSRALHLSRCPSERTLVLKVHINGMMGSPGDGMSQEKVPPFIKSPSSFLMASVHLFLRCG